MAGVRRETREPSATHATMRCLVGSRPNIDSNAILKALKRLSGYYWVDMHVYVGLCGQI